MIMTGAKDPDNTPTQPKKLFQVGAILTPMPQKECPEDLLDQLDPTDIAQKRLVEKMWYLEKPVIAASQRFNHRGCVDHGLKLLRFDLYVRTRMG